MKRAGWVIEKAVRKAERAWFLDSRRGERSPASEFRKRGQSLFP